jgi:hypothetical protein
LDQIAENRYTKWLQEGQLEYVEFHLEVHQHPVILERRMQKASGLQPGNRSSPFKKIIDGIASYRNQKKRPGPDILVVRGNMQLVKRVLK